MLNPMSGLFFCIACNRVLPEEKADHLICTEFKNMNDTDYRLGLCKACGNNAYETERNYI